MNLKLIEEGLTKLYVPKKPTKALFFNPKMELARDLTVLILNTLDEAKDWKVLDALTGIGARGIRIARETNVKEVVLNDVSEKALAVAEKNVELNGASEKVVLTNKDANLLMSELKNSFDYVDIDPFGSPIHFIDAAARALKKRALLGITATDTAPLSGTYPVTCMRRYGVKSYKTEFYRELGLRTLISSVALVLARWGYATKVLVSYAFEHYFRAWLQVIKKKSETNKMVKRDFGVLSYCPRCKWRKVGKVPVCNCENCGKETVTVQPLWVGNIEDEDFVRNLQKKIEEVEWLKTKEELRKLLGYLENESKVPFYYDLHVLASLWKVPIPKMGKVIEKLRSNGFNAFRTHFSRTSLKTDANLEEIKRVVVEESF